MSAERWLPVPGAPLYEVSDHGRVRSWRPRGRVAQANGTPPSAPKALRPAPGGACGRYRRVCIYVDGVPYVQHVARLVLQAFRGIAPGMTAAHQDGDPSNNHLSNLRWMTHRDNCAQRTLHGTELRGERRPWARLTAADVLDIRSRWLSGEPARAIATDHRVTERHVAGIARGDVWAHVPMPHGPNPKATRRRRRPA